jgi:hypothetical protein
MEWGITFLDDLKKMKEEMDRVWNDLFEKSSDEEEVAWQRVEKLPKSEGAGRRSSESRSNKTIKSF